MDVKIVPAILRRDFKEIYYDVESIGSVTKYVQIDVSDGLFTDTITWPFSEVSDVNLLCNELDRLSTINVEYELDVMVQHPEKILSDLLKTSVKKIIIHLSSTENIERCIYEIQNGNREVYLAIGINDNLKLLEPVIDAINGVQCMGVAHIGRQGELFDSNVVNVIKSIKEIDSTIPISVDGGQSKETIPMLLDCGVEQFCIGSAIFKGDAESNYNKIKEIVELIK